MTGATLKGMFPEFILKDKNGYALACAIKSGLDIAWQTVQAGLDTLKDPTKMPEWRLDEMAWETNCLYDVHGTIEDKRKWIQDAMPYYEKRGTPSAIQNYLEGYFDRALLEEWHQYGGEPYHFRITLTGDIDEHLLWYAQYAVETGKNVRSALDGIAVGVDGRIIVTEESGHTAFSILRCGENTLIGQTGL